jgi:hypothetical protein
LLATGKRQLLKPIAFDLNEVVRICASLLRRSVPSSIRLDLALAEELRPALADPGQIEQVLINLALNARDAMPKGGVLRIASENSSDTQVAVSVEDTGAGVDPAMLDRVFEPFFTTKPSHLGSGLGLSVAQGIVRQSGGTMTASNSERGGARFVFTLPVGTSLPEATVAAPTLAPPARTTRILVVDDEPMVRKITARILRGRGHQVLEASEGADALTVLQKHSPRIEVLLTDVVMPGMSGPKLVEAARATLPDLAVVYMTGYDAGALQAETRAVVIQKPFAPEALCGAIETATCQGL